MISFRGNETTTCQSFAKTGNLDFVERFLEPVCDLRAFLKHWYGFSASLKTLDLLFGGVYEVIQVEIGVDYGQSYDDEKWNADTCE